MRGDTVVAAAGLKGAVRGPSFRFHDHLLSPVKRPFVQFHNITKRFPGVLALDSVSLAIDRGSCHALVGENGAGKSTLGKILAGIHTADSGEIHLEGKVIHPASPWIARKLGIAMVHQELAFCPNLTVAENLCLGDLPRGGVGWLDRGTMRQRARQMLAEIESDIDVDCPVGQLSTGHEQVLQIAAAVGTGARIIIFDEPTSSLSIGESEHLFNLISRLKQRSLAMMYVSHRIEEIFRLCEVVSVLRDGRHIATAKVAETTPDRLVEQMVGRKVVAETPRHLSLSPGQEVLRVKELSSAGRFRNTNFSVRAGEILGFAGLIGAGRSELAQAIMGLDSRATGKVFVHGKQLVLGNVHSALEAGLGLVPEDRKRQGLILTMNCRENASLAALESVTKLGFVQRRRESRLTQRYIEPLRVKTPSQDGPVASLSGGNQQKIALAKWLARECRVLIVDEPTRGVDVGAKKEIHMLLDELACQGMALVLISSELPEVMSLSTRIIVLRDGELAGEVQRHDFSQENLVRLMAGVRTKEDESRR
jgi:ribose transport system ATP-binding protein